MVALASESFQKPHYQKILLKLSGEILSGNIESSNHVISSNVVDHITNQVVEIYHLGVQVAIVIGGGNIIRGEHYTSKTGMDRATADYMGMMATVINGLALQHQLETKGITTRLQTAIEVKSIAEPYIRRRALRHLEKKRIVIFAAGTGNPFFTTDTAAALRAIELNMDVILKATNVSGIYEEDPSENPNARQFSYISFIKALQRQIKVMDSTAFSLCMDNKMPIHLFNLLEEKALKNVILGAKNIGTLVNIENKEILIDGRT